MLVSLTEVLKTADRTQSAIGSFNTPNLESLLAVLGAAEQLRRPVILMHAQIHEEIMPLDIIGPIMCSLAERASVPVCVHLDHGTDVSYVRHAVDLGFTSVMYDGSTLPYAQNVSDTCAVVAYAHARGVAVEAEIGVMGKRELGAGHASDDDAPERIYTDPQEAARFVRETGIDALACSFGTAHGLYLKKPQLDFTVLERVRQATGVPLVMHGGSGVSPEDYRNAIAHGVRKINYYTYMAKAGGDAVRQAVREAPDAVLYFHDLAGTAERAMCENVRSAIALFSASLD